MDIQDYQFQNAGIEMNYKICFPNSITKEELPLIIYLHGAGERGEQVEHLYRHGLMRLIHEGKEIPAVVLAPQCPAWCVWDNIVVQVKALIDQVVKQHRIAKNRILLTGSSMGGFGTWMLTLTYPNYFAGVAPVAGGGMSWRSPKLCTTPIFAVHGSADSVVPIVYSKLMVESVNEKGGQARLLILDNYEHNDGIEFAYEHTELIEWLLCQCRTNFEEVEEVCSELF